MSRVDGVDQDNERTGRMPETRMNEIKPYDEDEGPPRAVQRMTTTTILDMN
jgi:hypothetical protein